MRQERISIKVLEIITERKYHATESRHSSIWLWHAFLPATKATPKEMLPIVDKPTHTDNFDILVHTLQSKGNEIQLTDVLKILVKNWSVYAYYFEGVRYDLGDKFCFRKANVEFAVRCSGLGSSFREYLNI